MGLSLKKMMHAHTTVAAAADVVWCIFVSDVYYFRYYQYSYVPESLFA